MEEGGGGGGGEEGWGVGEGVYAGWKGVRGLEVGGREGLLRLEEGVGV